MRSAFAGVILFFVVYVPCTAIIGLLTGSFQAPGIDRNFSYELFLWFVVAVQLLIPTFIVFLCVVGLLKLYERYMPAHSDTLVAKLGLIVMVGVALPTVQALLWGGYGLSIEWFAVAVVSAVALALFFIKPAKEVC